MRFPAPNYYEKMITIRNRHRYNIKVGDLVRLECAHYNEVVEITSVTVTTYGEISEKDIIDDGFENFDDMFSSLLKYYPDIGINSPSTIYRWKSIS